MPKIVLVPQLALILERCATADVTISLPSRVPAGRHQIAHSEIAAARRHPVFERGDASTQRHGPPRTGRDGPSVLLAAV
jgi:hypothetical protein